MKVNLLILSMVGIFLNGFGKENILSSNALNDDRCIEVSLNSTPPVPPASSFLYSCDDFDNGPAPNMSTYVKWQYESYCNIPAMFPIGSGNYEPLPVQILVDNTSTIPDLNDASNLIELENTVINSSNGVIGGQTLSIGAFQGQGRVYVVRKEIQALTTGVITFSYDQQAISQNGSHDNYILTRVVNNGNQEELYNPIENESLSQDCYGPGSTWTPFTLFPPSRYKPWYSEIYQFNAIAGETYYIDLIVGNCSGANHLLMLFVDNLCIEQSEPSLGLELLSIDDDDCDFTTIKGKVLMDDGFALAEESLSLQVKQGTNNVGGPLTHNPGAGVNITFNGNHFTAVIDNSYFPQGSYDVGAEAEAYNIYNNAYIEHIQDNQIINGIDNDGDSECCNCGEFVDSYVSNSTGPNVSFTNNETLLEDIHVGEAYTFNFVYNCANTICDISIDNLVTNLNGNSNITTNVVGNILQVHYTGNELDVGGLKSITIYPKCGPNECQDSRTVDFIVGHCECGPQPDLGIYSVENIEDITPTTPLTSFDPNDVYAICTNFHRLVISTPCNSCYDCAEFEIIDHNLPNITTNFNVEEQQYEIDIYPDFDYCTLPSDTFHLTYTANCGTDECSTPKTVYFRKCIDEWIKESSECLQIIDKSLVQSQSGNFDVLQFAVINHAAPIGNYLGPNFALFTFPNGVLNPVQAFQTSTPIPIPPFNWSTFYSNSNEFGYAGNRVGSPVSYSMPGSAAPYTSIAVPQGERIGYYRFQINENKLDEGFHGFVQTYKAFSPIGHMEDNTEAFFQLLDVGNESILFCDETYFCVSNYLPQAKMAQPEEYVVKNLEENLKCNIQMTKDDLYIKTSSDKIRTLTITNVLGQTVFTKHFSDQGTYLKLSKSELHLTEGIFVIQVNNKYSEKVHID